MSPRDTFDQYVFPSMKDFEDNPVAKHRAVSALSYIDALAEDVWNAVGQPGTSAGDYRNSLAKDLIELAYARDVHDIHKHGMLDRKSVVLPNGRRFASSAVPSTYSGNSMATPSFSAQLEQDSL